MKINGLLAKYGRMVCLREPPTQERPWPLDLPPYRAFIQPLRYKNKMYLNGVNTEIGFNSQGYYLYIGPPEPNLAELAEGVFVAAEDSAYQVDRAEQVYFGSRPLYQWAILRTVIE